MGIFQPLDEHKFVISFNAGDLTEGLDSYPVMTTSSSAPISGLAFAQNESQYVYDSLQIPSNYIEGSDVTVGVHYFNTTTQSGASTCVWTLDYQILYDNDNLSTKYTTTTGVAFTMPVNVGFDTYHRANIVIDPVAVDNPLSRGKLFSFRLHRSCSCSYDTMFEDAILALLTFEFPVEAT